MRCIKLIGILLIACSAFGVSYGQSATVPGDQTQEQSFGKAVHLWPNPADPAVEYVHVKVEHVPASKIKLSLHNIIGNEIAIETEVVDEHELRVKVKDLASG